VSLIGLKLNPLDLSSFSALTLLVGSPIMTYNVFSGTLSLLNQSITFAISYPDEFLVYTYFVAVKLNLTVSANNVNYHEIASVPNYYLLISSETKHCE